MAPQRKQFIASLDAMHQAAVYSGNRASEDSKVGVFLREKRDIEGLIPLKLAENMADLMSGRHARHGIHLAGDVYYHMQEDAVGRVYGFELRMRLPGEPMGQESVIARFELNYRNENYAPVVGRLLKEKALMTAFCHRLSAEKPKQPGLKQSGAGITYPKPRQ